MKWALFALYLIVTIYLAWLGKRKTQSLASFAVGNRDMNPWIVAFALTATMTSTATFVINPGLVYAFGLSAVWAYGVSAGLGLMIGVVVLSKGFRKFGFGMETLTVPQWLGQRYGDRRLSLLFAAFNLLLIGMVVLIAYGSAVLVDFTFGLAGFFPNFHFEIALGFVIIFVFTYSMAGGTYAHAYTNTIQGILMLVIAVVLFASGLPYIKEGLSGLTAALAAESPMLVSTVNPHSLLCRNLFEVFVANFVVGFAIAVQPHFLIKSLYVKTDRDVNKYLTISVLLGFVFSLTLLTGLFARVKFGPSLLGSIDSVSSVYIVQSFSPTMAAIIAIALLAAAMSTLDGILVALSAIIANDFYLVLWQKKLAGLDRSEQLERALRVGKHAIAVLAVVTFGLAWHQHYHKEFSVAIFAQTWIYALFGATFVPLVFGMFIKDVSKVAVLISAFISIGVHIVFKYGEISFLTNGPDILIKGDYLNPALTASYGLIAGLVTMALYFLGRPMWRQFVPTKTQVDSAPAAS